MLDEALTRAQGSVNVAAQMDLLLTKVEVNDIRNRKTMVREYASKATNLGRLRVGRHIQAL